MTQEEKAVIDAAVKLIGESSSERDIDPVDYRCLKMAVNAWLEGSTQAGGADGK